MTTAGTGAGGTGAGGTGAGGTGTAGTGTAGTGTMAGTGTGGTSPVGTQLYPPDSYVLLTAADAPAGAAAPAAWTTAGCNVCHGDQAQGVSMFGPEIRHTPSTYAQYIIRHGRPKDPKGNLTLMVAFDQGTLTDADMTSIITWLDGLPKPTTGDGLYKDFCGNCHGPMNGNGGNVPVKITGDTMANLQMFVRQGFGTDPSMRNMYMPPEDATALTDAELGLIATYLTITQ